MMACMSQCPYQSEDSLKTGCTSYSSTEPQPQHRTPGRVGYAVKSMHDWERQWGAQQADFPVVLFWEFLFIHLIDFLTCQVLLSSLWQCALLCLHTNTKEKEKEGGRHKRTTTSAMHRSHRAPPAAPQMVNSRACASGRLLPCKAFVEERLSSAEVVTLTFFPPWKKF